MTQSERTSAPVTIKQLARALGLSHSTVSRALNDHPAISIETKTRIRQAASKSGYVPNSAARVLRNERSGIIGLVIPDIQNDFYTTVAKTISDAAAEQSWQMILASTDDQPERENLAVRSLLKVRAEGVIIVPTASPEQETLDMVRRLHAVQLVRSHSGIDAPAITVADRLGVSLATTHLLELGHTRIGYIGSSAELSTGRERLQGFLEQFSGSMLRYAQSNVHLGPPRSHFGASAFKQLLASDAPPSAIVLGSPEFTLGVMLAAEEENVRIPDDLSLVGYGDFDWNKLLCGGLTAVALPEQEIADACVEMLHARFGSAGMSGFEREQDVSGRLYQPRLVVRGSSRRYPG